MLLPKISTPAMTVGVRTYFLNIDRLLITTYKTQICAILDISLCTLGRRVKDSTQVHIIKNDPIYTK